MKNVNLFLQSAGRSDLCGYNMAAFGRYDISAAVDQHPDLRPGGAFPEAQWLPPRPGMQGIFILGHQTNVCDALCVRYTVDGVPQPCLTVTRNRWTPAWMDTIYRAAVRKEVYPYSGTTVIHEKKTITREDVFIAHVSALNELRAPARVALRFSLPMEKCGDGYVFDSPMMAAALMQPCAVHVYMALAVSLGEGEDFAFDVPALGQIGFRYALAFSLSSVDEAKQKAREALIEDDPFTRAERAFNEWFSEYVPVLETENADMLKVYYYRWFLVYRSVHQPSLVVRDHPITRPCMYESIMGGWYGAPVGLPVPWQIEEAKWMRKSDLMTAHIDNWTEKKTCYQEYIQFVPWAAWHAYCLHPDKAWLRARYGAFKEYMARKIDLNNPQVPRTRGSWVTGAEYQPAFYQHTPGQMWDWRYDAEGAEDGFAPREIYRLDEICYDILSLRGCALMARELGFEADEKLFENAESALRNAVLCEHWDRERRFFFDRDAQSGLHCDQAAGYDGFAPFIDGIAGTAYHEAFLRITDPDWFGAPFVLPTAARHCPMFWFDNCIAGPTESSPAHPHDYGCSWNGTVWLYADSLVAAGLGDAARKDTSLRALWLRFFAGYTELHFVGGDRSTPLACEHYRCDDGATFSIANDYFHSSWIDPFIRYALGVTIKDGQPALDPFTEDDFRLSGVVIGDREYTFSQWHENGERRTDITSKATAEGNPPWRG